MRYRIGVWSGDGPEYFADSPALLDVLEKASTAFFQGKPLPGIMDVTPGRGATFGYYSDRTAPPEWARQAIIYQVFVDRFAPGTGRDWIQTTNLRTAMGGTLWGVREHLDHLSELGANCLWLTPIFASNTHHGYDALDLLRVEPRFGGEEALRAVVEEAHARGIRVILDIALNHISHQHPIFLDAAGGADSPYRDWFTFDDSPIGYRTFAEVRSMPQMNVANAAARRWLIDIGRHWLREFDVDGYRLDYANGPGPDFWGEFSTAMKAERPDCFCFGEIIETPDHLRKYVGRLDGCLDFHVCEMLRRTYALGTRTEADLARFLERHAAYFPGNFVMPTFVDNHDMDRFLFVAKGDKDSAATCGDRPDAAARPAGDLLRNGSRARAAPDQDAGPGARRLPGADGMGRRSKTGRCSRSFRKRSGNGRRAGRTIGTRQAQVPDFALPVEALRAGLRQC